jgi:hypothetical protein
VSKFRDGEARGARRTALVNPHGPALPCRIEDADGFAILRAERRDCLGGEAGTNHGLSAGHFVSRVC